ncbi:uncharacterized protein [Halyomorpha halys]|uniref:uncharacterized protein n=1 Tax=Halyomorpha halys TaxID=286706 RepID=UPI0006D5124D|nr:uncharacterized protein LOC106685698 [Halyomorpha halys]
MNSKEVSMLIDFSEVQYSLGLPCPGTGKIKENTALQTRRDDTSAMSSGLSHDCFSVGLELICLPQRTVCLLTIRTTMNYASFFLVLFFAVAILAAPQKKPVSPSKTVSGSPFIASFDEIVVESNLRVKGKTSNDRVGRTKLVVTPDASTESPKVAENKTK